MPVEFSRNILRPKVQPSLLQSSNIMVTGPVFYVLLKPSLQTLISFLLNSSFVLMWHGRQLKAQQSELLSVFYNVKL